MHHFLADSVLENHKNRNLPTFLGVLALLAMIFVFRGLIIACLQIFRKFWKDEESYLPCKGTAFLSDFQSQESLGFFKTSKAHKSSFSCFSFGTLLGNGLNGVWSWGIKSIWVESWHSPDSKTVFFICRAILWSELLRSETSIILLFCTVSHFFHKVFTR